MLAADRERARRCEPGHLHGHRLRRARRDPDLPAIVAPPAAHPRARPERAAQRAGRRDGARGLRQVRERRRRARLARRVTELPVVVGPEADHVAALAQDARVGEPGRDPDRVIARARAARPLARPMTAPAVLARLERLAHVGDAGGVAAHARRRAELPVEAGALPVRPGGRRADVLARAAVVRVVEEVDARVTAAGLRWGAEGPRVVARCVRAGDGVRRRLHGPITRGRRVRAHEEERARAAGEHQRSKHGAERVVPHRSATA